MGHEKNEGGNSGGGNDKDLLEAVGKKNDNPGGTSLVSLTKDIKLKTDLIQDIKLKTDTIYNNAIGKIYPLLANSVTLSAAVNAWSDFPLTKIQIVPRNIISNPFTIYSISVSTLSAVGDYVIALYSGNSGSEVIIGYAVATRSSSGTTEGTIPIMTSIIPANTRISAAMSSGNTTADTAKIKIYYYEY